MQHIPPMLLELRNVDVVFDGIIQVLRSVNLEVRAGKVTALLGGNGAGKTTTLKAISGLLAVEHGKVTDGQIRFEGEDISNADPVKLFRESLHRRRGPAVLAAPRRRRPEPPRLPMKARMMPRSAAGRLDHHPAGGQEPPGRRRRKL